jgi:uncharacterized cupin superfamily protein
VTRTPNTPGASALRWVSGKIGINLVRLAPGEPSSWPRAEEKEEEFVYVLDDQVDAWINGSIDLMELGDLPSRHRHLALLHQQHQAQSVLLE